MQWGHQQQFFEKQWAYAKTAVAAAAVSAMGPSGDIGCTSQRNNGPKRSQWQDLLQMRWAHPRISAIPLRKIMGPGKVSGSSSSKYNGPIRGYRQHLSEK